MLLSNSGFAQNGAYPWLAEYDAAEAIVNRISPPEGYRRAPTTEGSFEHWLTHLQLKKGRPPVHLFNGRPKANQDAHVAVVDMDVGSRNLQQCADAIIRLRAEYLSSIGDYDAIHFNFTSGHRAEYTRWVEGYRPVIESNRVTWVKSSRRDASYKAFRSYLDTVFTYAGSYSLSRELNGVVDPSEMRIGDVFIQGGHPGHAVIVVDMVMVIHRQNGKKFFLLAQSYMPAQEMHVLRNPANAELDPWYELDFGESLLTPEWTFHKSDLKRF
ncbi:MAG: DUF4846 domain-containing protein [Candidatus Lindowbacteria bacterium]|nr:DUF4846 domain-containing protein [Candidatus Lindowbacteria bacterium]